jgi:hypothetical protein
MPTQKNKTAVNTHRDAANEGILNEKPQRYAIIPWVFATKNKTIRFTLGIVSVTSRSIVTV